MLTKTSKINLTPLVINEQVVDVKPLKSDYPEQKWLTIHLENKDLQFDSDRIAYIDEPIFNAEMGALTISTIKQAISDKKTIVYQNVLVTIKNVATVKRAVSNDSKCPLWVQTIVYLDFMKTLPLFVDIKDRAIRWYNPGYEQIRAIFKRTPKDCRTTYHRIPSLEICQNSELEIDDILAEVIPIHYTRPEVQNHTDYTTGKQVTTYDGHKTNPQYTEIFSIFNVDPSKTLGNTNLNFSKYKFN